MIWVIHGSSEVMGHFGGGRGFRWACGRGERQKNFAEQSLAGDGGRLVDELVARSEMSEVGDEHFDRPFIGAWCRAR